MGGPSASIFLDKKIEFGWLRPASGAAVPGFAAGSHSHMTLNQKPQFSKQFVRLPAPAGPIRWFFIEKLNLGGLVWLPAPAGPGDAAEVPFSYVSQ